MYLSVPCAGARLQRFVLWQRDCGSVLFSKGCLCGIPLWRKYFRSGIYSRRGALSPQAVPSSLRVLNSGRSLVLGARESRQVHPSATPLVQPSIPLHLPCLASPRSPWGLGLCFLQLPRGPMSRFGFSYPPERAACGEAGGAGEGHLGFGDPL